MALRLNQYQNLAATYTEELAKLATEISVDDSEIAALEIQLMAAKSKRLAHVRKRTETLTELRGVKALIRIMEDNETMAARRAEDESLSDEL